MAWTVSLGSSHHLSNPSRSPSVEKFQLSYIDDQLIALFSPKKPLERETAEIAAVLFDRHQPSDLLIWELRLSSRSPQPPHPQPLLPSASFHSRLVHFPIPLRHVCPLSLVFQLLALILAHQRELQSHVDVLIGGGEEGRLGLVVCCLWAACGRFCSAEEGLKHLEQRVRERSRQRLVVNKPSQRRYAGYFDRMLADRLCPDSAPILPVKQLLFANAPARFDPSLEIYLAPHSRLVKLPAMHSLTEAPEPWTVLVFDPPAVIAGDVLFRCRQNTDGGSFKLFDLAVNTHFLSSSGVSFSVSDLDRTVSGRSFLPSAFTMEIVFDLSYQIAPPSNHEADKIFLSIIRGFHSSATTPIHPAAESTGPSIPSASPVIEVSSVVSSSSPLSYSSSSSSPISYSSSSSSPLSCSSSSSSPRSSPSPSPDLQGPTHRRRSSSRTGSSPVFRLYAPR
ncbi:MAG: hypothetical protein Q8P67_05850 [archaeon]|nr:hypothetical protein [archaeon]